MEDYNLEITVDKNKYSNSFERILETFISYKYQIEDLRIQKNVALPGNSVLLSIFYIDQVLKVSENSLNQIIKFVNKLEGDDFLISSDKFYNDMIKNLFHDGNFEEHNNIMWLSGCSKDRQKIINYVKKNNYKVFYSENHNDIELFLKYQRINNSNYYKISDKFELENIKNMEKSRLLKFPYFNQEIITKYIMLKSFAKYSETEEIPGMTLKDITKNLEHRNFVETVDYSTYLKIAKYPKVENFQFEIFDDLEDALSYNITLTDRKIHGILIPHLYKFYVCYQNFEKIEESYKIEDAINLIIENITRINVEKYGLKERSLFDLVNMNRIENEYIFEDFEGKFTDSGKIIPLESFVNRGLYFFNVFDDLTKTTKKNYQFNRKELEIFDEIEITIIEKSDYVFDFQLKYKNFKEFYLDNFYLVGDELVFKKDLILLWKKGYFLTDFGLNRYIKSGEILRKDIKIPDWFKSNNEKDFEWIIEILNNIKNSLT